jgi:Carboxypeptidase regulatory-like domain
MLRAMKPIGVSFLNCKNRTRLLTIGLLFLAVSAARLHAQGYGSIVGTVSDASGATVTSATVTVTQIDTGRQTTANSAQNGAFVFPSLPPTSYSLSVSSKGFETYQQSGIVLQADQSVTVNVRLAVGSANQTVEVTSEVPQVDTTTGTLSQVIGQASIVDLPLNGRNAASLVTLVAGVVVAPGNGLDQGSTKTFPVAVSITANGSQADQSNFLLNGGNNLDELTNVNAPFPFPDALQEFSVQTSNYNAEYGQSAGAVVNIVTKSGGSRFHGDLFEFFRNGYFNAKPYFASSADTLHRNQFGGTIGGPVIIPHLSSGARTQFFFGYQKTISHQLTSSSNATVPTLTEEGLDPTTPGYKTYGDFGSVCTSGFNASGICTTASQQIFDPFNLTAGKPTALPYNRIPVTRFDPASVAFEKLIPTPPPGTTTTGAIVFYAKPTLQSYNEYFARVDHNFGDKDHLFGHYYYNDFAQEGAYDPTELLSYASFSNIRYQNALLSETHSFTNSLLNNLIVNYQREISLRGGPPGSPDITNFGVNIWQPTENNVINSVAVTNYFTVSGSAFASWQRNNYTFNDDIHWVKGSHNFAFGGHIELSKFDLVNVGSTNGSFGFNATNTNNALASYQLGYLSGLTQGIAEFISDRNHFPGLYAQDSWKATSRLTLNYGVRWEAFAAWNNNFGGQTVFSPANYVSGKVSSQVTTLPAGMLVSGDAGVPRNGVNNQYKQFMPRIGFAYDVYGNGKTVVRGGGGIFYQDRLAGFLNLNQVAQIPYTISVTLTNPGGSAVGGPFSNPYCTGCTPNTGTAAAGGATAGPINNPFPYTTPFPANYVFPRPITLLEYDPSGRFRVPVTNDYNLTVEQQIFNSLAFRLAYVGSASRHQFINLDINPSVNTGTSLSADQRRAYNTPPFVAPCTTAAGCKANYTHIVEASMSGSGNYNSLQATLEKRMSHGLSLLANYTWSKAIDDLPYQIGVSNVEDLNAGESYVYPLYPAGASTWNPPNIKALDIGPSDFNHTNVFSASYVYNLPKVGVGNRFVRAITNGWNTSGLIQHHSGDMLTPVVGASKDISLTGLSQDRGQLTGRTLYTKVNGSGNCLASTAHCINFLSPGGISVPVNTGPNSGTGFGNAVKGDILGPAFTNWDAAVIRSFPIYRESNLEFRAEYFDVLNHVELGDPTTNPTSASYGNIGSTIGGPRIAQFSLKVAF